MKSYAHAQDLRTRDARKAPGLVRGHAFRLPVQVVLHFTSSVGLTVLHKGKHTNSVKGARQ